MTDFKDGVLTIHGVSVSSTNKLCKELKSIAKFIKSAHPDVVELVISCYDVVYIHITINDYLAWHERCKNVRILKRTFNKAIQHHVER